MMVLVIYPSSLLGWSALYGPNSSVFMAIITVVISCWIVFRNSVNNTGISRMPRVFFILAFPLILLLYFRLDTFLVREVVCSFLVLLYFTGNTNNFHKIRKIFRFTLIISLGLYVVLQFVPYDFGIKPIHGPLNLRDSWGDADYYTVFGLLLDRVQDGRHFLRYSAHFLEPTWLWLYLFIFTNKVKKNIVDILLGLISVAWFGLLSLVVGGVFVGLRREFVKFLFVCVLLYFSLSFIRSMDIYTIKIDQMLFMVEKGFFYLPDISLFGGELESDRRFGLGILNVLSNYGLVGVLVYFILLINNLNIAWRTENKWTMVITIAFSLFSLKAGGFLIPHVLYTISLKYDNYYDHLSTK
ncbi:hypothetical protein N9Q08_05120 [Schleiferiaceae bacterium]|nr:hypothetical protein [Schleiferiaceae bacterium]